MLYHYAAERFPESVAIPLGELTKRLGEFPSSTGPLIVRCKAGGSSARSLALLRENGIADHGSPRAGDKNPIALER